MPTELHLTLGSACLLVALIPSLAYMITTFDFSFLSGLNFWLILSGAIATGIIGSINVLDIGLNATGTQIAFVGAASVTYFLIVNSMFPLMGIPSPWSNALELVITLIFAIGVYLIIIEQG